MGERRVQDPSSISVLILVKDALGTVSPRGYVKCFVPIAPLDIGFSITMDYLKGGLRIERHAVGSSSNNRICGITSKRFQDRQLGGRSSPAQASQSVQRSPYFS